MSAAALPSVAPTSDIPPGTSSSFAPVSASVAASKPACAPTSMLATVAGEETTPSLAAYVNESLPVNPLSGT